MVYGEKTAKVHRVTQYFGSVRYEGGKPFRRNLHDIVTDVSFPVTNS
jgi:hypothetical protein